MSLRTLTNTTTMTRLVQSQANFGRDATLTPAGTFAGMRQTLSASESQAFDASGQRRIHRIFCSRDPGVTKSHFVRDGAVTLRVLSTETEGRPGRDPVLWVIDCEEHDSRGVPSV